MDAVLLTWRWQNFLSIAIMVILIGFLATFAGQMFLKTETNTQDKS